MAHSPQLTSRLTSRRRGRRWAEKGIFEVAQAAERKARAAVGEAPCYPVVPACSICTSNLFDRRQDDSADSDTGWNYEDHRCQTVNVTAGLSGARPRV